MTNDSSTGGYVVPTADTSIEGGSFDALLQAMVVGVVGLPGPMVRPSWQTIPPKTPEPTVNWCAFGVIDIDEEATRAQIVHDPDDEGSDQSATFERVSVLFSFYGPDSLKNASLLNTGLKIPQNSEALFLAGVRITSFGKRVNLADLVNERWVGRGDQPVTFVRRVQRVYPILNLVSARVDTYSGRHGGSPWRKDVTDVADDAEVPN